MVHLDTASGGGRYGEFMNVTADGLFHVVTSAVQKETK